MMACPPPKGDWRVLRLIQEMAAEQARRDAVHRLRWLAGAALFVVVVSVPVWLLTRRSEPRHDVLGAYEQPALAEEAFTEGLDAAVLVIGVPIPEKPLKHWKAPPCDKDQRAINEACWAQLAREPGSDRCGTFYEWQGACWAPVAKPHRAPQSLER